MAQKIQIKEKPNVKVIAFTGNVCVCVLCSWMIIVYM